MDVPGSTRSLTTFEDRLLVETFDQDWTLVALLGPGAALESASINDVPIQLVQRSEGLFWLAETQGGTLREIKGCQIEVVSLAE